MRFLQLVFLQVFLLLFDVEQPEQTVSATRRHFLKHYSQIYTEQAYVHFQMNINLSQGLIDSSSSTNTSIIISMSSIEIPFKLIVFESINASPFGLSFQYITSNIQPFLMSTMFPLEVFTSGFSLEGSLSFFSFSSCLCVLLFLQIF